MMAFERLALVVPSVALLWVGFDDAGPTGVGLVLSALGVGITTTSLIAAGVGRAKPSSERRP